MNTKFAPTLPERPHAAEGQLKPADTVGALPASITATETAAAMLRAYLDENGLSSYRIFQATNLDLDDINDLLVPLGEADCAWELPPPQIRGGQVVARLTYSGSHAWEHASGFLRLFGYEAVIARWYWTGLDRYCESDLWLVAAPSAAAFATLRQSVLQARREANRKTWQIIGEYGDEHRPPRSLNGQEHALVLPQTLRDRISAEVLRFFSPEVAAMYRELAVPYRRGVLLYGPPGNGKTSLIRWIAACLPDVSAISVRAWQGFDSNDLTGVINQWTSQAPALLVLEDLDWLLQQVNVSTFLNQLDGISVRSGNGGLLLIATTNHPEKLDGAINNRPGRFDACIEMTPPDAALRERFLGEKLPAASGDLLAKLVAGSNGLSFAHLQEILRLSGLRAINAGRSARSDDDLLSAVADVGGASASASRGFLGHLEMPFGLGHLRKAK